ncbi:hypothetical protein FNV43_RR03820 [Rhamnella rubrinervis]|uniref:Uncharacterized protein n=1 Tax=Rhamnella rubrinervis TaxID=2594499 RepID=A0A8K0MPZ7_9ROSA|nr:hypothetical protein FNV43_RR03820 [Rhamnella rubrinervis]
MKSIIISLILLLILVPAHTNEEGFISVLISNKGLDFVKDVLINNAISSIIPLQLPPIEKTVKIPVIGKVHFNLSNLTIYSVDIGSSYVETGDTGVVLVASGATAHMSVNWSYSYHALFIDIQDHGTAAIEVEDMQIGVTVALEDQEGTLRLNVLDSGCNVEGISVKLDGGASWLYQVVIDAFGGTIRSKVEDNIPPKITEGMIKLDSLLQSLPKQITVNDIVVMNVTFVGSPVLSNSSIELEINGLFSATDDLVSNVHPKELSEQFSCNPYAKMVEISLHENVFNSLSSVLFDENYMHWIVDKVPDQSLLNTSKWRYIVPQLYKQYPDDYMDLNITVSSPPTIKVVNDGIDVTIYLDVTVDVLDADEVIPVVCLSLEISASCTPDISGRKLVGSLELEQFTALLKWSKIGNIHMNIIQCVPITSSSLVTFPVTTSTKSCYSFHPAVINVFKSIYKLQPAMSVVLKTVIFPYVNLKLWQGIPLPLLHGFTLHNADIFCADSRVVICSDAAYAAQLSSFGSYLALSK